MHRLVLAVAVLLPLPVLAAGSIENASVVEGTATQRLGFQGTNDLAFGFVAEYTHNADAITVYVDSYTNGSGGTPRQYGIGIQDGDASGPSGTWLGGATNFVIIPSSAAGTLATFDLTAAPSTPVPLTAGNTYYVVISVVSGNHGSMTVRTLSPNVSRIPRSQALSARSVWNTGGTGGIWQQVANAEPPFLITCDDADPGAGATCAGATRIEGNPYGRVLAAAVSPAASATQDFDVAAAGSSVTAVNVPLVVAVASSFTFSLSCSAAVIASGPLVATKAAGPSGSAWYAADVMPAVALPVGTCSLTVAATSGSGTWPGAGSVVDAVDCDPTTRASFDRALKWTGQDSKGGAIAGASNDGVFHVDTCDVDCPQPSPDAGAPGLDASASPGPDASALRPDAAVSEVDASTPGLDAAQPANDASALAGEDAAAVVESDAAAESDAEVIAGQDAGTVASADASPVAGGDASAPPMGADASSVENTSVYGCGCRSVGGLLPLMMVFLAIPRRRRR